LLVSLNLSSFHSVMNCQSTA